MEQAQRSEEIAKKQLEDAEREPEVIEKYMEPEDYQETKMRSLNQDTNKTD